MRPQVLKISLNPEHSFSVRHDIVPVFYNKWHYHEELELVYILKGSGSLFIGFEIIHYKAGDLVLIGSNLPHMWGSDKERPEEKDKCQSYVIHFLPECFGENFFSLPENKLLALMLEKAQKGIAIKGRIKESIVSNMQKLLSSSYTERIILLLTILNSIGTAKDNKPICSEVLNSDYMLRDSERLNDIYLYTMKNFSRPLKLSDVADIANMTTNSFCRYFKSRTRKSFYKFLIEVRIHHACKLLAETELPIADICYDSGYNSFSNFNRQFLSLVKTTPHNYRKYQRGPV